MWSQQPVRPSAQMRMRPKGARRRQQLSWRARVQGDLSASPTARYSARLSSPDVACITKPPAYDPNLDRADDSNAPDKDPDEDRRRSSASQRRKEDRQDEERFERNASVIWHQELSTAGRRWGRHRLGGFEHPVELTKAPGRVGTTSSSNQRYQSIQRREKSPEEDRGGDSKHQHYEHPEQPSRSSGRCAKLDSAPTRGQPRTRSAVIVSATRVHPRFFPP